MTLQRLVLGLVCSRVGFVLASGMLMLAVVDAMSVSQVLSQGTAGQVLWLYLLRAPEFAVTMLPAALVMGSLLAVGHLAKHHELSAIKSCGGSMARVLGPPLGLMGVAGGLGLLLLTELVLPATTPRAVDLQHRVFRMHGPRYWAFYWPRRWMRTPGGFLQARQTWGDALRDVTYVRCGEGALPLQLVRAAVLRPEGDRYVFEAGSQRDLSSGALLPFETLLFPEPMRRGALAQHLGYPEAFRIPTLIDAVWRHGEQGAKVTPFVLALWRRAADPLLLLALVVALVPVAAWARRGQPTERRLLEGAVFVAAHVLLRSAFGALAGPGFSSGAVAAFGPVVVVAGAALVLWRWVEHEGVRLAPRRQA